MDGLSHSHHLREKAKMEVRFRTQTNTQTQTLVTGLGKEVKVAKVVRLMAKHTPTVSETTTATVTEVVIPATKEATIVSITGVETDNVTQDLEEMEMVTMNAGLITVAMMAMAEAEITTVATTITAEMEMAITKIILVFLIKMVLKVAEFLWECLDPPWTTLIKPILHLTGPE